MDALKKFLNKKKTDKAFKSAGTGHKLTAEGPPPSGGHSSGRKSDGSGSHGSSSKGHSQGSHSHQQSSGRTGPSGATKDAAAAALARFEKQKGPETDADKLQKNRQMAYIREQARKELEAERQQKEQKAKAGVVMVDSQEEITEHHRHHDVSKKVVDPAAYAVSGVYFSCPLISPEISTKEEIEENIKVFLLEQPEEELGVTSCLLIHSCNKPFEKITNCVETLSKCLDNIINNPQEPKYRKIRCSNQAFQNKVASAVGADQFLRAAGFKKTLMKSDPAAEQEEEFWVFHAEDDNFVATLVELRDTLKQTTPIRPEIDRNVQVLMPAQVKQRRELPDEFYTLSAEEIRKEQQLKTELLERETTLRTKAMKERDELKEQRLYRYAIMRIRFPDAFTLQGTFKAHEKLGNLYDFVRENLVETDGVRFELIRSGGETLTDLDSTLAQLKLAPSSILNFKVDSAPAPLATGEISYLKPETLALVRTLE